MYPSSLREGNISPSVRVAILFFKNHSFIHSVNFLLIVKVFKVPYLPSHNFTVLFWPWRSSPSFETCLAYLLKTKKRKNVLRTYCKTVLREMKCFLSTAFGTSCQSISPGSRIPSNFMVQCGWPRSRFKVNSFLKWERLLKRGKKMGGRKQRKIR